MSTTHHVAENAAFYLAVNTLNNIKTYRYIPVLIAAVLLALLAMGIAKKARHAQAPPLYDPLSYYSKSFVVWQALKAGKISDMMNREPVRPPGTTFIHYPAGFGGNLKSYLFRSTFSPVLIWTIATVLLILPLVRNQGEAFLASGCIAGLMCIPVFYHFQKTGLPCDGVPVPFYFGSYQWGMVDALQGALAALSVGLLLLALSCRSWPWGVLGGFFAAYTLFIKPSGALVMIVFLGIAALEFLFAFWTAPEGKRAPVVKFGLKILLGTAIIYGLAAGIVTNSAYMNSTAIARGVEAQKVDIMLASRPVWPALKFMAVPFIGVWWLVPLGAAWAFCLFQLLRRASHEEKSAAGFALVRVAAVGLVSTGIIWWWTHLAGMEFRFLFPFILMWGAWFIPDFFRLLRQLPPGGKKLAVLYYGIPAVALTCLLFASRPSVSLQKWFGYNLTNRDYAPNIAHGKWLEKEAKRLKEKMYVYTTGDGIGSGVIEMVTWAAALEHQHRGSRVEYFRPNVWDGHPGIRLQDIMKCQFILTGGNAPSKISKPAGEPGADWLREVDSFRAFANANAYAATNGLELSFEGVPNIIRVTNRSKLRAALWDWSQQFIGQKEFRERNEAFLAL